MERPVPPDTFLEKMRIPQVGYRTAVAVKHDARTVEVDVTFVLREQDGRSATYTAVCPRCNAGELSATVGLTPEGDFAEAPACPTLCLDCEDAMDAMLDPAGSSALRDGPGDRASLSEFLKLMNSRSWDR